LWRFDNTISEFWAYFHSVCAETVIKELPVKNLTPPFAPATSISYKTDALPLPSDVYWIYSSFCATTSHDLVTLRVFRVQCLSCRTHKPIFIILRLSVTELRVELCAAAAAPPPPTECRRRADAVFVTCSRHVVHQLYVARFL